MEINHKWLKFVVFVYAVLLAACGSDTYHSGHFEDLDDNFGKSSSKITSSTSQIFNENIAFEGRFAYVPEVGKAYKKEPLSTLLEKCYNSGGIRLRRDFDASKTDDTGKAEGSAV